MIKKISINIFIALLIFLPIFVLAYNTNEPDPKVITIGNPLKCTGTDAQCGDIMYLIVQILNNIIMPLAAVLCVMYIIWAGFKYVTARGNPGEITKAHQNLQWALIGTGILLGAAGISKVLQTTIESITK